ncbi:MAG TPA: ribonuclease E inhibitor RraB [Cyclobacteriaceae bacterium]|nr:ribonuclease E inhibitor RraB [Cyclobacteriaceae bacterium]
MSIFDFLKPFISERFFERHKAGQKEGAGLFLRLLGQYESQLDEFRQVEFFFYTKSLGNATSLRDDLLKLGYEIYGIEGSVKKRFSLMGVTCPMSLKDEDFRKWVEKMNELGFINDCLFDGWGVLTRRQA